MTAGGRPVALITGASAGLGREFARQLARRGYDLVLVSRDQQRLQQLAEELHAAASVGVEVLRADLTVDDDVSRVVSRIDKGPLDLLVNNAGFGTRGSLARTSREGQEAMLRVHVLAFHRLAQAAVQAMSRQQHGAIILVSSVASWLSSPGNVNYNATKGWQRMFAESLALELEGTGVYVQALCPGYTHTEFHQRGGMNKGSIPAPMWMSSESVVKESMRALDRRRPLVVVPGFGYKLAVTLIRVMPQWVWRRVVSSLRGRQGSGAHAP
jgi:short-subunit dehydrogenase